MSQNLKDKLAAFLALSVAPESEALVTALVDEVEQAGLYNEQMKTRLAGIESNEQRKDEFFADLNERIFALEKNAGEMSTAVQSDGSALAALTERVVAVEKFAQPLLGVVELQQPPPAQ